jgi:hypothetical protein
VVAAACHNGHYSTIWRTSLGIGVVFPMILFVLRLRLREPEEFTRNSMKYAKTPYLLCLKYYWFRLFIVSLIWFIYDVSFPFLSASISDLPPSIPSISIFHLPPSIPSASISHNRVGNPPN